MATIYIDDAARDRELDLSAIERDAVAMLSALDESASSLSLSFVDDVAIAELNGAHRGKPVATDVLSFPLDPGDGAFEEGEVERLLGDVVISLETARRQADAYDATLQREVQRLLIHGILHLLGHDHLEPAERARMDAEERRLADVIGMPWPYLRGDRE